MRTVLDICSGGGGEALGLEMAGFTAVGAVEYDKAACATLRLNRPSLNIFEGDIRETRGADYRGVDLLAGGVPCPPFTIAGKQAGDADERDLFPEALRLVAEARPVAVLLENVPGFAAKKFDAYRSSVIERLSRLGYSVDARILNSSTFGVPQLRPRFLLIAIRPPYASQFHWPVGRDAVTTVGDTIGDLMGARGWLGVDGWRSRAQTIAPTLVGGSKKHGGPDLGPMRAKTQWEALAVDGWGIANEAPGPERPDDFHPRLTLRMAARLQGFPDDWAFVGGKTAVYRQIGNALPPPVAAAVGAAILGALHGRRSRRVVYTIPATPRFIQGSLLSLQATGSQR